MIREPARFGALVIRTLAPLHRRRGLRQRAERSEAEAPEPPRDDIAVVVLKIPT
ncbi:hypothetical protein [Microbispora triticiradicis]|uniref:hypothetical protein n=1 Tax=Microbispora triticiradicis TaxID=2200763 RepID=UPI001AD72D4B|nr:hypothetical protein [Microbispora triticiradicis]MBO4273717.1 hypothetical protein [Microbispora triticiradicis]